MLHQLMDPRGEYLEHYRHDGCEKLNTSSKVVYVTQLSGALIIQLNILKFIGGINKKVIPHLSIGEEIVLWGKTMILSGVIYHEGQQSECGHYTSQVQMDNTWFFISDTTVLKQKKFQCNSRDVSIPYILIYKRRNNLLMPLSSLLNDTAGILSSDSTPDIMIRQSVLKELEKHKTKIAIAQGQDFTINHGKSPVKRKSKFASQKLRENGNRKKFMRYNLNDDEREQLKEKDKIRKKQMRDKLDDNKIGELKNVDNKRKKKNVPTLILMKRNC